MGIDVGLDFWIGCVAGVLGCGIAYATMRLIIVRYYIVLRMTPEVRQRIEQLRVLSESPDRSGVFRKALAVYDRLWREVADEDAKVIIRMHGHDHVFDLQ
jgi:hypothetical protein